MKLLIKRSLKCKLRVIQPITLEKLYFPCSFLLPYRTIILKRETAYQGAAVATTYCPGFIAVRNEICGERNSSTSQPVWRKIPCCESCTRSDCKSGSSRAIPLGMAWRSQWWSKFLGARRRPGISGSPN